MGATTLESPSPALATERLGVGHPSLSLTPLYARLIMVEYVTVTATGNRTTRGEATVNRSSMSDLAWGQ